jgi:hypothetical protein
LGDPRCPAWRSTLAGTVAASQRPRTRHPGRRDAMTGRHRRTVTGRLVVGGCTLLAVAQFAVAAASNARSGAITARPATFALLARQAQRSLLGVFLVGGARWRLCDARQCPVANRDWGADSLTGALYLRWSTTGAVGGGIFAALATTAPWYPPPCRAAGSCPSWSDEPVWDAVALMRDYAAAGRPAWILHKAQAALRFVSASGGVFAAGRCPEILYQLPGGGVNHLKTLETDANEIQAALLVYAATHRPGYLDEARRRYGAVRRWFFDRGLGLYSVYVFDDGTHCQRVAHRFFASVNGLMISDGLALARATRDRAYRTQADQTAQAVIRRLADPAGVFADLQAENDVAEPLVEAMTELAVDHEPGPAHWLVVNATAAAGERAADGAFGRFFDGPSPPGLVTAWQTAGGYAVTFAAAAIAPQQQPAASGAWLHARRHDRHVGLGDTLVIDARSVALVGTIGEVCCEAGHARVLIDGVETTDQTGIWQNKSSLGASVANTVLFAWRWPQPGRHTLRFVPGSANAKEGGGYLDAAWWETG